MGSPKYKIVYIHQDALITGSAISLGNMIKSISNTEYLCSVVVPEDGPAINIWKNAGAEVHIFPFTTFWTSPGPRCLSRGNIKQFKALLPNLNLRKFIKSLKPDILHINDKAALQAGVSMRNQGVPIIQHSRSAYHLTACKLNRILSAKTIRSFANHIICISEDEIQEFEKMGNMEVLFNTVSAEDAKIARENRQETREKLGFNDDIIVIGMAENMSINKGLMDIITIIKELHHFNNIVFLLVGKLNSQESLKSIGITMSSEQYFHNFITENRLEKKVILTGHKSNPLHYIAAMDLLVVSKAHGVLGRQPLEAQATGTAVVAINGHSKKSTIVKNGEGGFLVDSKDQLISTIRSMISDKNQLKFLGENGLIKARKDFNMEGYTIKLKTIYQNLLSLTINKP